MSEARSHGWSLTDFQAWEEAQDHRYEFVGGQALLMAGGTQAHAIIAANLVALLRPTLRGSGCRPYGSDLRIPIPATGNLRYPDVTVDCGRFDPTSHNASEPKIVFEILSASTAWYDQTRKLKDYEAVEAIRQYVCISQSEVRVSVWLRGSDDRFVPQEDIIDPAVSMEIAGLSFALRVSDIYEDVDIIAETPSGGQA